MVQFWFVSADLLTERSRGKRQRKRPPAPRTRGGPGTQPSRPSPCQAAARWSESPLYASNYLWTFQRAVGGRSSFGTDNEAYNSRYGNSYSSSYSVCNKIKDRTFGTQTEPKVFRSMPSTTFHKQPFVPCWAEANI